MEPQIDLLKAPDLLDQWEQQERERQQRSIFNISLNEFRELCNAQVDITSLYILQCISQGIDIVKEIPSSKVKGWYQTLLRRGYITHEGTISETGKSLLEVVKSNKPIHQEIAKIEAKQEDGFEKWWAVFPSNDIFTHKGKTFKGSRTLRVDKPKCRVYFDKIINEGEYTVDDMIRSLKYELDLKKELSTKENDNKMRYLSASTAYLNQRKFEGFMEASKNTPIKDDSTSTQYSGFDI